MQDYVGAYNLSHSPSGHTKKKSPSMSPSDNQGVGKISALENQNQTQKGIITEYHASGRNSKLEKTAKATNLGETIH